MSANRKEPGLLGYLARSALVLFCIVGAAWVGFRLNGAYLRWIVRSELEAQGGPCEACTALGDLEQRHQTFQRQVGAERQARVR